MTSEQSVHRLYEKHLFVIVKNVSCTFRVHDGHLATMSLKWTSEHLFSDNMQVNEGFLSFSLTRQYIQQCLGTSIVIMISDCQQGYDFVNIKSNATV